MLPMSVMIDGLTGAVQPSTGHYVKRLSELGGLFEDVQAFDDAVVERDDPIVYEVREYRVEGSDLFFGTTTMHPGKVGGEYYMTRGHYHARDDRGEVYHVQSGSGVLVLENRAGESRSVPLEPGACAFIPPGWAHRSAVVGSEKLVFLWVCNVDAGNDYREILERGMRLVVVEEDGAPRVRPNPRHLP
jgi:glucose-6-phosphate isomerase, archaeal